MFFSYVLHLCYIIDNSYLDGFGDTSLQFIEHTGADRMQILNNSGVAPDACLKVIGANPTKENISSTFFMKFAQHEDTFKLVHLLKRLLQVN